MTITPDEKKELKGLLEVLVAEIQTGIAKAKNGSAPVELDQSAVGRVSRIDAIQQQKMVSAGLARLERRLAQVKSALLRIDADGFGECSQCEEPISIERLRVSPEALLCVNCAT